MPKIELWEVVQDKPDILRRTVVLSGDDEGGPYTKNTNRVFSREGMIGLGVPTVELDKFPQHPGQVFGWRHRGANISERTGEPAMVTIDYVYQEWSFLYGELL